MLTFAFSHQIALVFVKFPLFLSVLLVYFGLESCACNLQSTFSIYFKTLLYTRPLVLLLNYLVICYSCSFPTQKFNHFIFSCHPCVLTSFRPVLSYYIPTFDSFCTSPQLLYVPAVSKYDLIFCCSPENLCVLPFLDICTLCCSLFLSLSYSTPVIWLIVFTAVNFHLVVFFLSTSSFDPCPACCNWVLPCGFGAGWSLCHPGPFLHCVPLCDPPTTLPLYYPRSCWLLLALPGSHTKTAL